MNKYLLIFTILFLFICNVCAQTNSIGIRDSRYLQYTYTIQHHFPLTIEQSLFSDNFRLQHIRIMGGYQHSIPLSHNNRLNLNYSLYFGGLYNGNYQDYGLKINTQYYWSNLGLTLQGILNPHYDTSFYYTTCYSIGAQIKLNYYVSLFAHYTNIPEYRQIEERVKTGFQIQLFSSEDRCLTVRPHFAIPVHEPYQNTRLHVDFAYLF